MKKEDKPKVEKAEKEEGKGCVVLNKQVEALLNDKRFKEAHLSAVETIKWVCGTGSVKLDIFLDGGIRPGYVRIAGEPESGKTRFALNIARNFQLCKMIPKPYVFVVNGEGRMRDETLVTAGVDTSSDKFFKLDCNVSEVAFEMIRELINNNPEKYNYLFIVDSLDSLCRQEDLDKTFSEAERVAGGALINSVLGKKTSLPLVKFGHCLIALSQTRANMSGMGYSQANSGPKTSVSGGKAMSFYSSLTIDIKPLWTELYIFENPSAKKIEDKGKRLGHYCVMNFKKTMNEKTGQNIQLPIRYGQKADKSIWGAIEFFDLSLEWDLLKFKGAWYTFDPSMKEIYDKHSVDFDKNCKFQGEEAVKTFLNENEAIVQSGLEKFRAMIQIPELAKVA